MRIALDAMGGDHAPRAMVDGAILHVRQTSDAVLLVGDEKGLRDALARAGVAPQERIEVVHASQVVEMREHAGQAIRRKRDSSMRVCFDLVKNGTADAVLSAGNSGAMMAAAIFVFGRLEGVNRPGIAALLPTLTGHTVLIDAGANPECEPLNLVQFAAMGEVYARRVLGVDKPRVGLLANGEEETKGTPLTRNTHAALRKSDLAFVGYVEGKDLFSGEIAVMVTDGFSGNAVLKTAEGAAQVIGRLIRQEAAKGWLTQAGAVLMRPVFATVRKAVDYSAYGGAPLLGVDGVTMIAHGRSTETAMQSALSATAHMAEVDRREGDAGSLREELSRAAKRAMAWVVAECAPVERAPRSAHADGGEGMT